MESMLLETDQPLCFDEEGLSMGCEGSGQDGEKIKHLSWKNRFQDLGGVVSDTFTGTIWTKDANPAEFPLTWEEAKAFVRAMAEEKAHGYENWQLAPRRLLFSLLSHRNINPSLPENHPFENVFPGYYWSCDSCHRLPDQAWYVHLGGARVPKGLKESTALVWPVILPADTMLSEKVHGQNRFIVKNETACDALTGLCWCLNANPAGKLLSWKEALLFVKAMNEQAENGIHDWRLPNIREMESLVDLGANSPALAKNHPFKNVMEAYWSATTSVYEPRYAWALYLRDGLVGVGFKRDASFYLWPVRG